jgi:hypothetical protein
MGKRPADHRLRPRRSPAATPCPSVLAGAGSTSKGERTMARGRTSWENEAEAILQDCGRALHDGQRWQQAIERHGEASRDTKHLAWELRESFRSIRWRDRRLRAMPGDWDSLSSASPRLAAALVKLDRAAEAAGLIADAGWRKGTKPDSWKWVERLAEAVEMLQEALASTPVRDAATEARNRYCYEARARGTSIKKIISKIREVSEWEDLTESGVRYVVNTYAKLNNLPVPRKRGPSQ